MKRLGVFKYESLPYRRKPVEGRPNVSRVSWLIRREFDARVALDERVALDGRPIVDDRRPVDDGRGTFDGRETLVGCDELDGRPVASGKWLFLLEMEKVDKKMIKRNSNILTKLNPRNHRSNLIIIYKY